jgi:putative Ca2+/H+ antiporter (TMEM165/GDT1 family)
VRESRDAPALIGDRVHRIHRRDAYVTLRVRSAEHPSTHAASLLGAGGGGVNALLLSTTTVALAELGDKTQWLALMLAARYRRPWPIALGILLATLANHTLAGLLGAWVADWFAPQTLRVLAGCGFLIIAGWTLIPDRAIEDEPRAGTHHGVLSATLIAFFLAEIGDKTQIATTMLAVEYRPLWQVVAGTTLGMLLADLPVVWLGARFARHLPRAAARAAAALTFATLGLWLLCG